MGGDTGRRSASGNGRAGRTAQADRSGRFDQGDNPPDEPLNLGISFADDPGGTGGARSDAGNGSTPRLSLDQLSQTRRRVPQDLNTILDAYDKQEVVRLYSRLSNAASLSDDAYDAAVAVETYLNSNFTR